MQSFLNKVAKEAIGEYKERLGELNIVLPSRRAIVFLKSEFQKELKSTSWLPQFYSLEDFIARIGNYHTLEQVDLLFELYEIHKTIEGENKEAFHEFINWGAILLYDFNEIDRYLIDPEQLFGFINEAKALEVWNTDGQELTEFQHKYLRFWKQLLEYYQLLSSRLLAQNKLYQGLGFRSVAEKIDRKEISTTSFKDIYFVGFNALTAAEQKILHYFKTHSQTRILWDADEYYLNDPIQEAGKFLRSFKNTLGKPDFQWVFSDLLENEKQIDVYGISGNIGQAKLIGNLLDNNFKEIDTAVVLANESLLMPVLESIPGHVAKVNVTMGYPISYSSIHHWIEAYLKLQLSFGESKAFHYSELKKVLESPFFQRALPSLKSRAGETLHLIEQEKQLYVSPNVLAPINEQAGISLFNEEPLALKSIIQNILELLDNACKQTDQLSPLELEITYTYTRLFTRLEELSTQHPDFEKIDTLIQLFRQLSSSESIDFVGEPLGGLQLMGVLESRVLDFENVIISSVNEGTLPSGKTQNSFIPFDIKVKFGLPSYKEKDAIFAYHFYRLLQRAKKVSIIYNTKADQLDGGERSRFIEQLIHELPRKNPNIRIKEQLIAPSLVKQAKRHLSISKNERIILQIEAHLKSGLSPSAINTFLNCAQDYYYKYLLGLKEEDPLENIVEDSTLGTIIHDTLEQLYLPYLNTSLTISSLEKLSRNLDSELLSSFKKELNIIPQFGHHKLLYEVASKMIRNLIAYDQQVIQKGELKILGLEQNFDKEAAITLSDGSSQVVRIKGKIDRIDSLNGELRVIDYKTGKTIKSDVSYRDIESLLSGTKPKAVQLLLYQYALNDKNTQAFSSGILSLRNLSEGFIQLTTATPSEDAEQLLSQVLERLLNTEEKMEHNNRSSYCVFCK
jgi:hypothetical protein